jgi:hypothetical protein
MNIFTKAMTMNFNMFSESTLDWIITEVDASFFCPLNDEDYIKREYEVDESLLDLKELVDMLFSPTCDEYLSYLNCQNIQKHSEMHQNTEIIQKLCFICFRCKMFKNK